jgi:hypothetical protein
MKKIRCRLGSLAVLAAASVALAAPSAALASVNPGTAARSASAQAAPVRPASQDTLTEAQTCAQAAAKAGFSFNNYISTNKGSYPVMVVAVAVGLAESSCNPSAVNPTASDVVGLWQINLGSHPNVSEACALNAQCNGDAAFQISNKGYNWSAWQTYTQGTWSSFVPLAEAGVYGYYTELRSQGTGSTCLDADSTDVGDGGKIFQWKCNSSDRYQQWELVGSVGDVPILRNEGTGTCLDADSTDVANGGKIFQWKCSTSDRYQQWWFYGSGDLNTNGNADAGLHSSGTGSTCMDADSADVGNGGKIFQWKCNQADIYQEWN